MRFKNTKDLLKHEMMHALGFGTVNPISTQESCAEELDFSQRAGEYVVSAFGCKNVAGILADDRRKTHLMESIYHDEMMTPYLSEKRNYFSNISAMILEDTHLNSGQWYKVNYRSIQKEAFRFVRENQQLCARLEKAASKLS
ncbi:unnamed protein product, partial [Mesorhabditis spiculigera]